MNTEVILVRHGETTWNNNYKIQGQKDTDLSILGYKQAKKVKEYLTSYNIDCIYSSDLKRAYATASEIASLHKCCIRKDINLRERKFGDWEGIFKEENPEITKKIYDEKINDIPPGGEDIINFKKRITDVFNNIITNNKGKRIIVITHGGCIRMWLTHILCMPVEKYWRLKIDNCSITIVNIKEKHPELKLLNGTFHLIN